ncbi:MAG: YbaK/EbsC family protein [Patescibacteria group bacterium]|nr:YbaK/EbsC family protein [Patescibacteria group bacterium]MDD5294718.1 YbaK/EbsC family protein [Patescibacteria group bacterium]MDD5554423.1 YbaK/EbsC family protein [Patescibacteria group bacterium]
MSKKTKLPAKLEEYLNKAGVKHNVLEHRTVYTAMDAAATMKKKMGEIAKSLLVQADRDYFLVLLPADYNLDFKKLGKCLGAQTGKKIKTVKIPGEKVMSKVLKIKSGTMSAFGKLHNLPVVADKALTRVKKAVFSSGGFNHSIEMAVKDFIKLENAVLGSFGVRKRIKMQKVNKIKKSKKR